MSLKYLEETDHLENDQIWTIHYTEIAFTFLFIF